MPVRCIKKKKSAKKNKKGTVTFTVEEAEKMEQLAKELETMKDQYLRLAAEYDNYRKRTAKGKEQIYSDAKNGHRKRISGLSTTIWNAQWPRRAMTIRRIKKAWR